MAKQYPALTHDQQSFIATQHIFFHASSAPEARVNISPKSTDLFRIIDANTVAYLDRIGSSNETAAHMLADGRITIMFCATETDGKPLILRLYGIGSVLHSTSNDYAEILNAHFDGKEPLSVRQIILINVDLVQTSCGFGVPLFDYVGERTMLEEYFTKLGPEGSEAYMRKKNSVSMDGLPTGLFPDGTND